MIKSTSKHLPHYAGLFGIFIVTILGFAAFGYDKAFQYALAFAVVVSYIVWGIVHHWIHKDLTASEDIIILLLLLYLFINDL